MTAVALDFRGGPWCQRWDGRRPSPRDVRTDEPARRGSYRLVPVPEPTARRYMLAHRYAGSTPVARLCYSYLDDDDGHLAGVAVLGVPIISEQVLTSTLGLEPYVGPLELSRFVCGPEVPANGESNFLRQMFDVAAGAGMGAWSASPTRSSGAVPTGRS